MVAAIDRLPPHNLEAEQSALGSILLDRDAIIRVETILRPEDFYQPAHGLIYRLPIPRNTIPSRISPRPTNLLRVKGSWKNNLDQKSVQM